MKLKIKDGRAKVEARVVKPLYGHTDMNSAYVVDDYPYGRLRTQKRFWLDFKPKKGWRFVGQTLNPKTGRWNKPKASTYSSFGACMYLDEKDHCQWSSVHEYSSVEDIADFVKDFPKADFSVLKKAVPMKMNFLQKRLSGELVMTMNGKPIEVPESEKKKWETAIKEWQDIAKRL